MSVGLFRMNQDDDLFELGFEVPISGEKFFTEFWEPAIDELGITGIWNGIEIRKDQLKSTLMELEQLRNWAQSNLQDTDLEYMVSRIDLLVKELPSAFKTDDTVLWMG
ncbi:hypothetical protein [Cohnella hashimotonis]|uniref:Uncharacterized protein n=1 Tax=Cohnella hashimotonis TaxID=2826895 RepID=A0ABT6TLY0_9BACL|nr:hypothetical protein [Cohnella hashimotonis]MDI4647867.1 hypothetical protein [Cohnella hashimotonis]